MGERVRLCRPNECWPAAAQVGARGNAFTRLVDQLRCVLVAKCGAQPFLELGPDASWAQYGLV
jgi:hypothetical protein